MSKTTELTEAIVQGDHGVTHLVRVADLDEEDPHHWYEFRGAPLDRPALIMLAVGIVQDLSDEEREFYGVDLF